MHIAFTLSTLPMVVLGVFLWFQAKGQLMPVAMFMSVFQAASVVNLGVGSLLIGVQPTYVVLLAALLVKLGGRRSNIRTWLPNKSTTLLLAGFVAYAAFSAFVCPHLFAGVLISNPKLGLNVPLKWELGHLNQLFYLLLSFAFYLVAAYWISPAELTKSLNWFVGGVMFASLIGLYQFVGTKTGLPFPSAFLHTSPTYAIFEGYEINGFPRMNSTFTEAAAAAFSLNMALALVLWRFLSRADSLRNIVRVAVIAIGLLITISTTGYVCLLFLIVIAVSRYAAPWKGSVDSRNARVLLAITACLFVVALFAVPAVRESAVRLAHTVILDKTNTSSYQTRTQWNADALRTAWDTHFFGAGWGVCRASSFVPTLLGNVGIPGALLFITFSFQLLRPIAKINASNIPLHGAVLFSLSAVFLDLIVSAPEIANPVIWLLFAVAARLAAGRSPMPVPSPQLRRLAAAAC